MIKVTYFNSNIKLDKNVSCIGYFDSVHLGHQELIKKTLEIADKYNLKAVLITFDPDPYDVITKTSRKCINSLNNRIKLYEKFGIKEVVIVPFNDKTMKLSPSDFKKKILDKLNIEYLVCGFDFTYGYMAKGNASTLKRDNMNVIVVEEKKYYGKKISTTRIRNEIEKGNTKLVNRMLGYEYKNK